MSEAEGGTSLDQLPKAVLKKILSYIPEQDDGNVRLVCKIFEELFDETIGVSWGKYCWADELETEIEDFEELPSCRSFDFYARNDDDEPISIPKFKSKRLLKVITLGGEVTDFSLNRLLTGLTSLEKLEFFRWGLSNLTCSLYTKDLINLKEIILRLSSVSNDRLYLKMINFLKIAQFQNLQSLKLKVDDPNCEKMFCDALLTFLIQHKQTLSALWINLWCMNQNGREDWPNLPDFTHRLNQLENTQIVKLTFYNTYRYKSTKAGELFDKIVQNGKMIEADECSIMWAPAKPKQGYDVEIYDNYDEQTFYTTMKPIPKQMIQNNSSTLVDIGMNIIPEDCHPLDCSIFIPCKLLKNVRLLTRENSGAQLVNVTALPQTMELFQVSNFQLKCEDIHAIATRNIGLHNIWLVRTGTKDGYGVTIQSFTSLIARQTKVIYINESWNLDDFMESLNHRGPFQRLQALSLLHTKKVKDGNGQDANVFIQPMKPKRIYMVLPCDSNTYKEFKVGSANFAK